MTSIIPLCLWLPYQNHWTTTKFRISEDQLGKPLLLRVKSIILQLLLLNRSINPINIRHKYCIKHQSNVNDNCILARVSWECVCVTQSNGQDCNSHCTLLSHDLNLVWIISLVYSNIQRHHYLSLQLTRLTLFVSLILIYSM